MIKQMLVGFLATAAIFGSGCTSGCSTGSVGCSIEKSVVSAVSNQIALQLQCSNLAAIQADIQSVASKLNMCSKSTVELKSSGSTRGLPLVLCSALGNLVANLAPKAIPAAWGCTAQNAAQLLNSAVVMGCQAI